ncbi:MAG: Lon-insertion domain-containing protein [Elusimicrobiota bacterium]|jgi:predicted ATP-dependent protease
MSNKKAVGIASRILSVAVAVVLAASGPLSAQNIAAARVAPVSVTGAASLAGARLYHVDLPNLSLQGGALGAPTASLTPSLSPTVASVGTPEVALPAAVPALQAQPVFDVLKKLEASGIDLQGASQGDPSKIMAAAESLPAGKTRDELIVFAKALAAPKAEVSAGLDKAYDNSSASAGESVPVAAEPSSIWNTLSKVRLFPSALRKSFAQRAEQGRVKAQPQDPAKLEVPVSQLRWVPAAEALPESTKDIKAENTGIVGQDRALRALSFGLRMPGDKYNLFVSGLDGSGRETAVRQALDKLAPTMPTPRDVVAATNFENPGMPALLKLAAGAAPGFQAAVAGFIEQYKEMLPQLAQSERLVEAKKTIEAKLKAAVAERQKALDEEVSKVSIGKFGLYLGLKETERGYSLMVAATLDGKPLTTDEVQVKVAAGQITQAEWDEAQSKLDDAAAPFVEKFQRMMDENNADARKAERMLARLLGKAAAQVADQLGNSVRQAVVGGGAIDPKEAVEIKARFEAAQAKLQEEIAGLKIGRFGVLLQVVPTRDGNIRIGIGLTLDGQPVTPELLEAAGVSMDEVDAAQAELKPVVMPYVEKMKLLFQVLDQEMEAASSKNAATAGPEDMAALNYVENLISRVAAHYEDFLPKSQAGGIMAMLGGGAQEQSDPAEGYKVNVISTNEPGSGAPVVFAKSGSFQSLFGGVETQSVMVPGVGPVKKKSPGGPTLFSGAFQQANGGFLVLNALDVLQSPGAWQMLMRAVSTNQAMLMDGNPADGGVTEAYMTPSKVKVVLIGSPMIRMMLEANDETFVGNFNAKAEFQSALDITKETIDGVLGFIKKMVVSSAGQVLDMTRDAISAVMEYSARLADSNEKLSAQFGALLGLMREASFWARESGRETVTRDDVRAALQAKLDREGGSRERIQEVYKKGVFRVDVQGAAVGQINGLAVMGDFGVPARITVVSSPGRAGIVSVDRDAGTSGPSFNKALGVIEGYLEHTFGQKKPISAHLRISFEQNYGGIDGDSATSTEIYAILSSLSGVPIQQRFAVTGSADQFGNVQAIGGANHKIEGFYAVASALVNRAYRDGLNAVLVPATNVKDLQLDEGVVKAVAEGKFKIYSVKHVSEGIELLTGVAYSEILAKVQARLDEFSDAAAQNVRVVR